MNAIFPGEPTVKSFGFVFAVPVPDAIMFQKTSAMRIDMLTVCVVKKLTVFHVIFPLFCGIIVLPEDSRTRNCEYPWECFLCHPYAEFGKQDK